MKQIIISLGLVTLIIASCVKDRITTTGVVIPPPVVTTGDSLICYFNCNQDTLLIMKNPTYFRFGGDSMSYLGTRFDTVQPGTTLNAYGSDTVLSTGSAALRLRNPSGTFNMKLPTTGFKNIVLKYAIEKSSKGSATNTVTYTVDGTNYTNTAIASVSPYTVDTTWAIVSLDFTADTMVNNNKNFAVKINFSNAASTTSGNDRFDNITLWGVKQ